VGEHDDYDDVENDVHHDGRALSGEGYINPQGIYSSLSLVRLSGKYFPDCMACQFNDEEFAREMGQDEHDFFRMFVIKGESLVPEFILHPDASAFKATAWERSFSRILNSSASWETRYQIGRAHV